MTRPGTSCDVAVIGGGIVGLAAAYKLLLARPGMAVVIPWFVLFSRVGLIGTHLAIIVAHVTITLPNRHTTNGTVVMSARPWRTRMAASPSRSVWG